MFQQVQKAFKQIASVPTNVIGLAPAAKAADSNCEVAPKTLEAGVQGHATCYTVARPTNPFSSATAPARMERGSKGAHVREMQEKLVRLGYMTPQELATGPGIFWDKTDAAVRRFQSEHGLIPDGVVGPNTRAAMERRLAGGEPQTPPVTPSAAPTPQVPIANSPSEAGTRSGAATTPGAKTSPSLPVDPPSTNSPGNRSAGAYAQVIDQFDVANNPRYAHRWNAKANRLSTYCNIFVSDVTRAMGAEIPHWVDKNGNPAPRELTKYRDLKVKHHELSANALVDWMRGHGERHGWRKATAEEAQRIANEGHPAVVLCKRPGGIGHVAVVRPGELTDRGPAIAQAGAVNTNQDHVHTRFGKRAPVEYWVHDEQVDKRKPSNAGESVQNGIADVARRGAEKLARQQQAHQFSEDATKFAKQQLSEGILMQAPVPPEFTAYVTKNADRL